MKLSEEGYRLNRSFEGYHDELPDGTCRAYRCPSGIWTIGYGTIKGVTEGLIWTREMAEEAMRAEMAEVEAAVLRLVTVEINQNQFDALCLIGYNIGTGQDGLGGSTLLKRLNAGDVAGAADAFKMWNKGRDRDDNLIELPGLVARRAREAAHFMKPIDAPATPYMSQDPVETRLPLPEWAKVLLAAAGAGTLGTQIQALVNGLDTASTHLAAFITWAIANPTSAGPLALAVALLTLPKLRRAK